MKFENRQAQFPGNRKLTKVDENDVPISGEESFFVRVEKAEGAVIVPGTPITADKLNLGNWQDNNCISFKKKEDDDLPTAVVDQTQIVTLSNGQTWVVPPLGLGNPVEIGDSAGALNADVIDTSIPGIPLDTKVPSTKLLNDNFIPISQKDTMNGVATITAHGSIVQSRKSMAWNDSMETYTPESLFSGTDVYEETVFLTNSSLGCPFFDITGDSLVLVERFVRSGFPMNTIEVATNLTTNVVKVRCAENSIAWNEWKNKSASSSSYYAEGFPELTVGSHIYEVFGILGLTESDSGVYHVATNSSTKFYTYTIHVHYGNVIIERNYLYTGSDTVEKSIGSFDVNGTFRGYSVVGNY